MLQYTNLVFYDGQCGLCDHFVRFLLKIDKKKQFAFAPLQGETADRLLKDLPAELKNVDSVILVENYESARPTLYFLSKAVFRIFWLLKGPWILLGWLCFLPSFLFDWAYSFVAKNRKKIFSETECMIPRKEDRDRFLP